MSISDELFSRPPDYLKIFVSSRMRGGSLDAERAAAVQAIDRLELAKAWAWERDALAGPYSSENVCVGHARTSDGLILILAEDLTPVTRREYVEAYRAGVPCYILLKEGVTREPAVETFITRERTRGSITVNFRNLSELETHITRAVRHHCIQSSRRVSIEVRCQRQTRRGR